MLSLFFEGPENPNECIVALKKFTIIHYIQRLGLDDFTIFSNAVAKGIEYGLGKDIVSVKDRQLISNLVLCLGEYMLDKCYSEVEAGLTVDVYTKHGKCKCNITGDMLQVKRSSDKKKIFTIDFQNNQEWDFTEEKVEYQNKSRKSILISNFGKEISLIFLSVTYYKKFKVFIEKVYRSYNLL
uniref:Uncharacterized protein n=1 Tax=Pithovirus LCDPAC02 TaxID=2506601 RepID=A0A481YP00_9VIRU|nr:MAG: hypothetical protein LCDPAC02_00580 [Pithovirus LCDPAC02]